MKRTLNRTAIDQALRSKGLNQSKVAEALQLSREAVCKWFSNESFPRPDKLLKLGRLLDLSYHDLVQEEAQEVSSFAYRLRGHVKEKAEDSERAQHMGLLLSHLASHLDASHLENPRTLKSPNCTDVYIETVCTYVRKLMGLSSNDRLNLEHLLQLAQALGVILIPVLWNKRDARANALRIYLSESKTTWIFLNLDSSSCDFLFWFAHELGHTYAPSLRGEDGETFADLFAQHLLYPNQCVQACHQRLLAFRSQVAVIKAIIAEADEKEISPIAVYKALEHDCHNRSVAFPWTNLNPYPAFQNYIKKQPTIAETYYGKEALEPKAYVQKSKTIFGSVFFDTLKKLKMEKAISASFIQQVMQIPLLDSKALWMAL